MRKLTKPENKFLQKKCNVKYPKITGANQNTRMYKGEPYNWSEKPFDLGKHHALSFLDGIDNYVFTNQGNYKGRHFVAGQYYDFNDSKKSYRISEPIPSKKKFNNEQIDTSIQVFFRNNNAEPKIIDIGLRTIGKNTVPLAMGRYVINDKPLYISLQDSPGTFDDIVDSWDNRNDVDFDIVAPVPERQALANRVKAGMYYYAVRSMQGELLQFIQRGVLLNRRPINSRPNTDKK